MPTENLDSSVFSGGANPCHAYSDDAESWLRLRCDERGYLMVGAVPNNGTVIEPTVAGDVINNAATVVESITNTTAGIITVFDNTTPVGLVLPLSTLTTPLFLAANLTVKSASAALGKKISIIWRPANG